MAQTMFGRKGRTPNARCWARKRPEATASVARSPFVALGALVCSFSTFIGAALMDVEPYGATKKTVKEAYTSGVVLLCCRRSGYLLDDPEVLMFNWCRRYRNEHRCFGCARSAYRGGKRY